MATASAAFKSRKDHRKQLKLEDAWKARLVRAELDENGKEINPHIPQYMSSAPWYLNSERPSLKHQRNRKLDPNYTKDWYDCGEKVFEADKFFKEACTKSLRASDKEVDKGKSVAPIPAPGGSGDNNGEYEIENAKSSRSICKSCNGKIEKGHVRVATMVDNFCGKQAACVATCEVFPRTRMVDKHYGCNGWLG